MVYRFADHKRETREKMRGGEGVISLTHLIPEERLHHARLVARIEVPVGASIGYHYHESEVEYYIILEGHGEVIEGEKVTSVDVGDVVVTGPQEGHAIRNVGSEPLVFLAIIQKL
ncbi:cupin domain-containing protein [Thermospira aquatica]|uniref:Cupin domain-containing protein n=1 Tax=Thermospira aquatica TaxID=2828656 RepID=A0AAX3BBH9_9SPIR|nr:cupin domain-containing protein [Thermospira aquatica]URA09491.1 cupin domain-containing protein [Thermospira aquatica]